MVHDLIVYQSYKYIQFLLRVLAAHLPHKLLFTVGAMLHNSKLLLTIEVY